MSEKDTEAEVRRRRVRLLKKLIIIVPLSMILILFVLCMILGIRLYLVTKELRDLRSQIETTAVIEQTDTLENTIDSDTLVSSVATAAEEAEGAEEAVVNAMAEDEDGVRKVYLTFDDGPSSNTDRILDILAEYDVKATFFVVGKEEEKYRPLYNRIVQEGHTLGMHSYSHKYQEIYSDLESFQEDFFEIQSFLMDVTGVQCKYYRFPGGSSNTVCHVDMRDCIDFLGQQEVVYFDWNVASGDATRDYISVNQIVNNVMGPIENNNWNTYVVLMHDASGKETTVEALPIILERLQAMEDVVIVPITDSVNTVQHVLPEEDTITED